MPQPDTTGAEIIAGDNTANHEGQDIATATQTTTTPETDAGQTQTEETPNVYQGVLDRLGVPKEIAEQIGLGQPEAEASTPPADPETDTPAATSETVGGGEAAATAPETTTGEVEVTGEQIADDLKPNKAWAQKSRPNLTGASARSQSNAPTSERRAKRRKPSATI